MDKFKYQPLDLEDQSFRLIQLFRGVLGPIQCNLFHSRFQDAEDVIEYEALSYTWGGNDKAYSIEVNGVETAVTKNLFTALRNLRTPHRDRILWIDAICIDQNSDKERGHQVQQMGTIYKRAEQVVIWLGEATAETDLVFQSVRALEERMIQYACNDWNSRDNRWSEHWSSIQSELEAKYGNLKAQQRKGLNNLLSRPWFKRIWIIQEVANARAATVICGSQSVSARIFSLIIPLIGITPPHHCQAIFDIMPGPARKHSWWMRDRRLHSLLIMFRASEASDQRDIIYALLGISSDGCDSNILRPDYEKSEEEVVQVTLSFLL
ncbi:heterokaryon incompatibility protein-domain-containing protein, partial [Pyrenochaeta sp. MPI-SDFR-AT-0127]